ncbi:hypothetical protein [Nocardioides aquiterrae]|uniref:Uncharacterized protein n=1 Tax=Nocardioides aquiterrae TaxID=203799 RepID=A0ABN1UTI7_9ACTN
MASPLESDFLFPGPSLLLPVLAIVVGLLVLIGVGVYLTVRAYRR